MTATYDPTLISTTPLYQVRFLVDDTNTSSALLDDNEIHWLLTEEPNVYLAASMAATQIAFDKNNKADREIGDLKIDYSNQARMFTNLAASLRMRGDIRAAMPWSAAHKKSRKETAREDDDRVRPSFEKGMDDNLSATDDQTQNDFNEG